LKPKLKVAVIVNQPINIIASLNKPDPTVFPGREEDLAGEITMLEKLDKKNELLPNLNDKEEKTTSTTVIQMETPPTDPEAVVISFAVYFTILTFLFNIISIPFH
jgi:hypothetical protein